MKSSSSPSTTVGSRTRATRTSCITSAPSVTRVHPSLVDSETCQAWRELYEIVENSTSSASGGLASLYERINNDGYIAYTNANDKTLTEATHLFAAEISRSAWNEFSADNNSVLLDVGSGTARFAAALVLAGVFKKAFAVEYNQEISRLVRAAYKSEDIVPILRTGLVHEQHKFGEWNKKNDYKAIDVAMLKEADTIFVNNFEFEPLNQQFIVGAIEQFSKFGVIVVSYKPLPPIARTTRVVHYETVHSGAFTFPGDKPSSYYVYYLDCHPILIRGNVFTQTICRPRLEEAMYAAVAEAAFANADAAAAAAAPVVPVLPTASPLKRKSRLPPPTLAIKSVRKRKTHISAYASSDDDDDDDDDDGEDSTTHTADATAADATMFDEPDAVAAPEAAAAATTTTIAALEESPVLFETVALPSKHRRSEEAEAKPEPEPEPEAEPKPEADPFSEPEDPFAEPA